MRRLVPLLAILATAAPAYADGFYFSEGYGGVDVKDDLSAHIDSAVQFRIAIGMRRKQWALEGWFAGAFDLGRGDVAPAERDYAARSIDGDTCLSCRDEYAPSTNLAMYGLDLKFLQPMSRHVEVYLRGRMSKAFADGSLDDHAGRGLGIGAGIQVKGKVAAAGLLFWPLFFTNLGPKITGALWLDSGYEFYRLHGSHGSVDGQLSTLSFGLALGSDF